MQHIRPALALVVLFTLLLGAAFPLAITGAATTLLPYQANGSLITRHGQTIGSALIGQNFMAPRYFHSRPSATTATDPKDPSKTVPAPDAADNSAASNLGPTSKALIDRVKGDAAANGPAHVPADMVTTSASGLDPDISPANALRQAARVAAARHMPEQAVVNLVVQHTRGRTLGIFGEPHINVLNLNIALDEMEKKVASAHQ